MPSILMPFRNAWNMVHNDTATTTTTTTTAAPFVAPAGVIIHYANLWSEEDNDDDGPPPVPYHVDLGPLLPFGMMLIISTIIFMLIIFRRWPGLVAGIVAGCLTSISIYLLLLTLKEQKLVYE